MKLKLNKRVVCCISGVLLLVCLVTSKAVSKADGNLMLEYTFSDNNVGSAAGTIKLSSSSGSKNGAYDIYWANESGKLSEYEKITSISLDSNLSGTHKMVSLNAIPDGANKIIAMKDNAVAAQFSIPSNKVITANKNFSFGALSDIHLDGDGSDDTKSNSDFQSALDYFKSKNVALIANSGDITLDGRDSDVKAVVQKISSVGIPVYTARGNHDCKNACSSLSEWSKIEPNGLIFEKTVNNEVFVFLGMNKEDYKDTFSSEQLSKLESILERNKDRRVFLFEHVFYGEVGNVKGLYPYSSLSDSGTAGQFKELMKKYQNVISFTGHSHLDFELQRISEFANVCAKDGSYGYRVHCPSASKPRKNDASTKDVSSNTYTYEEGSLGYLVDVYNDYIVLKGRDFVKNINLPNATYILYTGANAPRTNGNVDNNVTNENINVDSNVSSVDTNVINNTTQTDINTDLNVDMGYVGQDNNVDNVVDGMKDSTYSGDVDVVLVIDKSISYDDRFPKAKEEVKSYINNVMSNQSARVGIVEYGLYAKTTTPLTDNYSIVSGAVDTIKVQDVSGSNMHAGVCNAIDVLRAGSASKKVIVIVSDGRTNRTKDDTVNHNREKSREAVKNELNSAKSSMGNLEVVTIDYSKDDDTASKEFLKSITTSN